ncbi:outer membrane protein assembly factor BamE [Paenibacillus sp. FSL R7-0216]|uniref:outer membrane protein assembly factor BamE domain-containing protein n=1 Tax=Paenibacillus sp. FSL R7-0216 TaxID=2921677 RepID=UPI0030DBE127
MGNHLTVERKSKHGSRWNTNTVLIMILVAILWTVFVSHNVNAAASKTNEVNGSIVQHPYLTVEVLKQKKMIAIRPGMTKQQVDQLLGKPDEVESSAVKGYSYNINFSTLFVGYLKGKVAYIFTSGYDTSLNSQFKFGSPWKKVVAKLGEPLQFNEYTYYYVFQLTNGKLKQIYGMDIQASEGRADVYTLKFTISESGNIRSISVEQSAFIQAMEDRFTKSDPNKPTFTEEEIIGIRNGEDKPITLGMRRETVEATYGKPTGQLSYSMVVMDTYGAISVYYRDEIVAAILVDPSPDAQTNKGLRMPANRKEVLSIYGEPTSSSLSGLSYSFEVIDDRLQAMGLFKSVDPRYMKNEKYELTFITSETNSDQIDYFILNDYDFYYDENNLPKPLN